MEYLNLKPFEQFVLSRNLVPEKYRSYYFSWIRRFLQSGFSAEELTEKDQVACFVDQLERDDSVEDWQVEQAQKAVKLYLDLFLKEQGDGGWCAEIPGETRSSLREKARATPFRGKLGFDE